MSEEVIAYSPEPIRTEHIGTRRFAGFWMRFWAYLADLVIVFSINGILLSPLKFLNDGRVIEMSNWTLTGILGGLFLYLYFIIMTKYFGQTIGKMIFGLKVIRQDEEPLKWSDVLFRELIGRFFYRFLSIANILYLVVAFDPKKQGLHDMVSDTYVVHE